MNVQRTTLREKEPVPRVPVTWQLQRWKPDERLPGLRGWRETVVAGVLQMTEGALWWWRFCVLTVLVGTRTNTCDRTHRFKDTNAHVGRRQSREIWGRWWVVSQYVTISVSVSASCLWYYSSVVWQDIPLRETEKVVPGVSLCCFLELNLSAIISR